MPYVKRMFNNQVFLEESVPFNYPYFEDGRKNYNAIEAGNQIMALPLGLGAGTSFRLSASSPSNFDQTFNELNPQYGLLPSLGPQGGPETSTLFSMPRNTGGSGMNVNPARMLQQYQSLGPMGSNLQMNQPTSYMTQGKYSDHPIFHS